MATILVTGGAGFIGSNFLNLYVPQNPNNIFVNLDKLTYAANPRNLSKIDALPNYRFVRADIADMTAVGGVFSEYSPDWIIHFAAESHVDRSIVSPSDSVYTNVVGTFNLLETARRTWQDFDGKLFHHVSTDEVFGSLGAEGKFAETTAYDPSSPYSAAKAGSDHFVRAYGRTYGLPVKITNCSNNYGPHQFPEKLIPLMVLNCVERKALPVYGSGESVRDFLYVDDHCEAIWEVAQNGKLGETYNIGGDNERRTLDVVHLICRLVADETGASIEEMESLIKHVPDRPGHDMRYAMDFTKLHNELGWSPRETFETGLRKTVQWYLSNPKWVQSVKTGAYRDWIDQNYGAR